MKKCLLSILFSNAKTVLKLKLSVLIFIISFWGGTCLAQTVVHDSLSAEAYFFYINDYPYFAHTEWTEDFTSTFLCETYPNNPCSCPGNVNSCQDPNGCTIWSNGCKRVLGTGTQGLAHDDENWYISSQYLLWKIPVKVDLGADDISQEDGVISIQLTDLELFTNKGYKHFGDPDFFEYEGRGFLFVPLTPGTGDNGPAVAVFDDNLNYLDVVKLPEITAPGSGGWCAISKGDSCLYASLNHPREIYQYEIEWDKLRYNGKLEIKNNEVKKIHELSNGGVRLYNMQGGEFSPSGDLLYLTCGTTKCAGKGDSFPTDGLHVFITSESDPWKEIQKATNTERGEWGCFNYSFQNTDCAWEEPEGLTIWDLTGKGAPHVSGQLHVALANHEVLGNEEASIMHYKSFKRPDDITVFANNPTGESASNPRIADLLDQGSYYGTCAAVIGHVNPTFFPAGKTPVRFDITDNNQVAIRCTSYVTVKNRHDQCSTALLLSQCEKVLVDNYCAGESESIPDITGYNGEIKDVWFKINKPNTSSFSIETYEVTGGVSNTVMQLLSGTCGNLYEIASDDSSGEGDHAKITITNYTGSWPLYLRVTDHGANYYGKFGIYYKQIETDSHIFDGKQFEAGDGSGVFQHPTLTGDVNGDGRTDLIFPCYDDNTGLRIRTKIADSISVGNFIEYEDTLEDGEGVFDHPTLTGDVNGDGRTDLIFQCYNNNTGLRIRTKMADSTSVGNYIEYEDTLGDDDDVFDYPTLTGDINGDGKTDLIFLYHHGNHGLTIKTKMAGPNGDGTFIDYEDEFEDGNVSDMFHQPVLTGDINGDGKTDIIFPFDDGNNGLTIKTKMASLNGDGTFTSYQDIHGDGNSVLKYPTLTGDVNGDGKTDLIFPFEYGINGLTIRTKMADSSGNGTFVSYQEILEDGNDVFDNPALTGDINGDGNTDLIFIGRNWNLCGLNIRIKFSKGDGTWCEDWQGTGDGSGVQEYPTLTGDINADSKTDLFFVFDTDTSGLTIRSKISLVDSCHQSESNPNQNILDNPFLIFPNPTNGYVEIRTEFSQTLNVRILNLSGMVLLSFDGINSARRLDLTSLLNGAYFIEIYDTNSGDRVVKKVIRIN